MSKWLKSCFDSILKAQLRSYIGELEYQEKMSMRYDQRLCDRCGKYHIWKLRATKENKKEEV